jgi:hypothetical protein
LGRTKPLEITLGWNLPWMVLNEMYVFLLIGNPRWPPPGPLFAGKIYGPMFCGGDHFRFLIHKKNEITVWDHPMIIHVQFELVNQKLMY